MQELFLDGKQRDAAAAVPDGLVDDVSLVGPPERIRDRLDAWRESGVTTLLVHSRDPGSVRTLAELAAVRRRLYLMRHGAVSYFDATAGPCPRTTWR